MAVLRHSCGIVGMFAAYDVVPSLHRALLVIQHRGQESAGLSVFDGDEILTARGDGLVSVALTKNKVAGLSGKCGIGHVRYSTTGSKSLVNAQPLTVETAQGTVAVAHNGDITNFVNLKKSYLECGWSFLTSSDSEIIAKILSKYLARLNDPVEAIRCTMSELDGAYSLVIMVRNRVFGVRDPYGFRPLCIGKANDATMVVSESAALTTLNLDFVRDVAPGEIIEITDNCIVSHVTNTNLSPAHCVFEWVYFARPESIIDGGEVYDVRKRIGATLAREAPADADLVISVPDSGRAHAIGYSLESGIPYEEGFMKNRFADRTFILPDQKMREDAVSTKMNPIKSTVNGKRIIVVDDSIVRGTTLVKLIRSLKSAGVKEVHVRVGYPPVIAPCYYGVDMKSRSQLIAYNHSVEEIRQIMDANSLAYISISGLVDAIGLPKNSLCLACVNSKYPTKISGETFRR
ncbi:MAG: amidophosphoribosyltransferase [archaeon]|nr:amidophosphoribosyltransferase [archaeon]